MVAKFNQGRFRLGVLLFGVGLVYTFLLSEGNVGGRFGARIAVLGPVAIVVGIAFAGLSTLPMFVTYFAGEEGEWDDLTFIQQMVTIVVVGMVLPVVVAILGIWINEFFLGI